MYVISNSMSLSSSITCSSTRNKFICFSEPSISNHANFPWNSNYLLQTYFSDSTSPEVTISVYMSLHNQEICTAFRILYPFYKASFSKLTLHDSPTSTVGPQQETQLLLLSCLPDTDSQVNPTFILLANSLEYPVEDPERIRVDSVFETSACVFVCSLSVCLQI